MPNTYIVTITIRITTDKEPAEIIDHALYMEDEIAGLLEQDTSDSAELSTVTATKEQP